MSVTKKKTKKTTVKSLEDKVDSISQDLKVFEERFKDCKQNINNRLSDLEQCKCEKEEKIPRAFKGKYYKKSKK